MTSWKFLVVLISARTLNLPVQGLLAVGKPAPDCGVCCARLTHVSLVRWGRIISMMFSCEVTALFGEYISGTAYSGRPSGAGSSVDRAFLNCRAMEHQALAYPNPRPSSPQPQAVLQQPVPLLSLLAWTMMTGRIRR